MNFQRSAAYSCTALMGTNKSGELTPDENSYYTVVLGALDFFNSAGSYYPYEGAKHLFEESSALMRRVRNGALRGEYGHPRKGNMTDAQFIARIMDIDEKSVCCHISDVWIDREMVKGPNGQKVVAILGKVKPQGPYGAALEASLRNPNENVCFSIRSLTNDQMIGGVNNKFIRAICTWDYVNEPGISVATKWRSPALESQADVRVSPEIAREVARIQRRQHVGIESGSTLSMESVYPELFRNTSALPLSASW